MIPLVIDIGNRDRGDDGIGPAVVDRLRQIAPEIDTAYCAGDLTRLMELWEGRATVILVDMLVDEDDAVGTGRTFDLAREGLPYGLACSSHSMDLAQCIELARALERLPRNIEVVGIVGAQVDPGAGLSSPVQDAVETICRDIAAKLQTEAGSHA